MTVAAADVADYILEKLGSMTAMKLQKLVYYSQAWHAVWEEEALFPERIEAWAYGPVVPALYRRHRGQFRVDPGVFHGAPEKLSDEQQESINRVLDFYGDKDPQWLSDLTHSEGPWKKVRQGMPFDERGSVEITLASMAEYYGSLSG